MKKTTLLLGALLAAGFAHAQQETPAHLTPEQQAYYKHLLARDEARRAKIAEYLRLHPDVKASFTDAKGYHFLHQISADGKPVYWSTRSNLELATSVKTDLLWTGGSLGVDIQGENSEISPTASRLGMWEPLPCRTSHQEFGGRATTRDLPVFTMPSSDANHAVHVAGTMIAAGVKANVKGMASAAKLDCYEMTLNETAEMLAAGSGGMLVSNHSYGPDFDSTAAQQRGFYTDECMEYDSLIRLTPNYLPVFAAGNARDDANGLTYDIVVGGALSKNVLSVAAIELLGAGGYTGPSSVVMSDFSSYGPTDDGRVKPDISAPGVNIYSAYCATDTSYGTSSGTSMASPGVAGSIYLLQQYARTMTGNSLRASTLKGLAIHGADEAGTADGPDYAFGWGLLNMEKSLNTLRNNNNIHLLREETLTSGTPYKVYFSTPGGAFKATLSWTDIAGTQIAGNPTDDRTPMLVNDLDVRLVDSATNTVVSGALPWKLNPVTPAVAATRGDNTVDNVEQIWVANLPAGDYYLRVTNKRTLGGGTQQFALMADGITPGSLSVAKVQAATGITVSPVPANNKLTIANAAPAFNGSTARVVDITGREVASFRLEASVSLDVQRWSAGIYTLVLADGSSVKLVKE